MTYRNYLRRKRKKKEVDSLGNSPTSTSDYTTYKDVLPMQFPVFNQPMGGPVAGTSGMIQ
jgi:hypothetical protein